MATRLAVLDRRIETVPHLDSLLVGRELSVGADGERREPTDRVLELGAPQHHVRATVRVTLSRLRVADVEAKRRRHQRAPAVRALLVDQLDAVELIASYEPRLGLAVGAGLRQLPAIAGAEHPHGELARPRGVLELRLIVEVTRLHERGALCDPRGDAQRDIGIATLRGEQERALAELALDVRARGEQVDLAVTVDAIAACTSGAQQHHATGGVAPSAAEVAGLHFERLEHVGLQHAREAQHVERAGNRVLAVEHLRLGRRRAAQRDEAEPAGCARDPGQALDRAQRIALRTWQRRDLLLRQLPLRRYRIGRRAALLRDHGAERCAIDRAQEHGRQRSPAFDHDDALLANESIGGHDDAQASERHRRELPGAGVVAEGAEDLRRQLVLAQVQLRREIAGPPNAGLDHHAHPRGG